MASHLPFPAFLTLFFFLFDHEATCLDARCLTTCQQGRALEAIHIEAASFNFRMLSPFYFQYLFLFSLHQ